MSTLSIKTPRAFSPLLSPSRYKGAHGGRGSGKSHFFSEMLIERCVMGETRAVCIREVQKSIKQSVKLLIEDKIRALGVSPLFRVQDELIRCPHGGIIVFQGMQDHTADSIKSLEGFDIAWFEESQNASQRSLDLLRPTIRKPGSELWFSWNPVNKTDPIDVLLRGPKPPADATVIEVNWRDNPWFSAEMMAEMEGDRERDHDKYLHVWEGHYNVILEGAIYAAEIRKAVEEKRICKVPPIPGKPVQIFLDLGFADHTSIWFAQAEGPDFRIIDFYQNQLQKTAHYLSVLQAKGYVYDRIFLPHDAAEERVNTERTVERQFRDAFANSQVTVLPNLGKGYTATGIEAVRSIFPQCWFDEDRCAEGIEALRKYRYERDAHGQWMKTPKHDENSHAADAFRYLAVALQQHPKQKPITYRKLGTV